MSNPPHSAPYSTNESFTLYEAMELMEEDDRHTERLAQALARKVKETCTYVEGYQYQPVYACLTCHPPSSLMFGKAGFCVACAMNCHLHHDVIELFKKRGFRCDCGNMKYRECNNGTGFECTLCPKSQTVNDRNEPVYNHNFEGKYCFCDGKYKMDTDVMFQCLFCLDWFHDRCLVQKQPEEDGGLVCRKCANQPFFAVLRPYIRSSELLLNVEPTSSSSFASAAAHAGIPATGATTPSSSLYSSTSVVSSRTALAVDSPEASVYADQHSNKKLKLSDGSAVQMEKSRDTCRKPNFHVELQPISDLFLPPGWLETLCHCSACNEIYAVHGLSFLFEENQSDDEEEDVLEVAVDESEPVSDEFKMESIFDRAIANIPQSVKITMAVGARTFIEESLKAVAKYASEHPGAVVTPEIVKDITETVKHQLLATPQVDPVFTE